MKRNEIIKKWRMKRSKKYIRELTPEEKLLKKVYEKKPEKYPSFSEFEKIRKQKYDKEQIMNNYKLLTNIPEYYIPTYEEYKNIKQNEGKNINLLNYYNNKVFTNIQKKILFDDFTIGKIKLVLENLYMYLANTTKLSEKQQNPYVIDKFLELTNIINLGIDDIKILIKNMLNENKIDDNIFKELNNEEIIMGVIINNLIKINKNNVPEEIKENIINILDDIENYNLKTIGRNYNKEVFEFETTQEEEDEESIPDLEDEYLEEKINKDDIEFINTNKDLLIKTGNDSNKFFILKNLEKKYGMDYIKYIEDEFPIERILKLYYDYDLLNNYNNAIHFIKELKGIESNTKIEKQFNEMLNFIENKNKDIKMMLNEKLKEDEKETKEEIIDIDRLIKMKENIGIKMTPEQTLIFKLNMIKNKNISDIDKYEIINELYEEFDDLYDLLTEKELSLISNIVLKVEEANKITFEEPIIEETNKITFEEPALSTDIVTFEEPEITSNDIAKLMEEAKKLSENSTKLTEEIDKMLEETKIILDESKISKKEHKILEKEVDTLIDDLETKNKNNKFYDTADFLLGNNSNIDKYTKLNELKTLLGNEYNTGKYKFNEDENKIIDKLDTYFKKIPISTKLLIDAKFKELEITEKSKFDYRAAIEKYIKHIYDKINDFYDMEIDENKWKIFKRNISSNRKKYYYLNDVYDEDDNFIGYEPISKERIREYAEELADEDEEVFYNTKKLDVNKIKNEIKEIEETKFEEKPEILSEKHHDILDLISKNKELTKEIPIYKQELGEDFLSKIKNRDIERKNILNKLYNMEFMNNEEIGKVEAYAKSDDNVKLQLIKYMYNEGENITDDEEKFLEKYLRVNKDDKVKKMLETIKKEKLEGKGFKKFKKYKKHKK